MVIFIKWQKIRDLYPHQWVKLNVLESHIDGGRKIINEMEVIKVLISDEEEGNKLGKSKENEAIYYTCHENISYKMTRLFGFKRRKANA